MPAKPITELQQEVVYLQVSSQFSARHSPSYIAARRHIQRLEAEIERRKQTPPGRLVAGPGFERDRRNWQVTQ
jgi:hypothetical protein